MGLDDQGLRSKTASENQRGRSDIRRKAVVHWQVQDEPREEAQLPLSVLTERDVALSQDTANGSTCKQCGGPVHAIVRRPLACAPCLWPSHEGGPGGPLLCLVCI